MGFRFVYLPNLPVDAAQTVLNAADECHSSRDDTYPARNPAFVQVQMSSAAMLGECAERNLDSYNALKIKPCVNSDHPSTFGYMSTLQKLHESFRPYSILCPQD